MSEHTTGGTARSGSRHDLAALLDRTSRTFALTIRLLPQPLDRTVTVAYLLFRIADTLEDAARWTRARRMGTLAELDGLLEAPTPERARPLAESWTRTAPSTHAGYLELLQETPGVVGALTELPGKVRRLVIHHVRRTVAAMRGFVARSDDDGRLELRDVAELRDYCYAVAGIVGEMLTELFLVEQRGLGAVGGFLRERARHFGEGLQLTNILKDADEDLREGRRFVPAAVPRRRIFALAHRGLHAAAEYTVALQRAGAERGLVAFNALPVKLAQATLARVERLGAGAKLTRDEVFALVAEVEAALGAGRPVFAVEEG